MSDSKDIQPGQNRLDPKARRLIGNARMVANTPADKLPEVIAELKALKPHAEND